MANAPFGFAPVRNMAAGGDLPTRLYRVTATGNTQGLFIGDPVRFNSSGLGVVRLSANAAANTRCLGVVAQMFDENGRPLTFSQPTRGPFLPSGTAGWAEVYDSQQITFICQADASAAESADARFAKALDRLQPLLLNTLTEGGTWTENAVSEQQVYERYGPTIAGGSPALWVHARALVERHFGNRPS